MHLTCNEKVIGSNPISGSLNMKYKLYDIVYKQPNGIINGVLPNTIYADLSKYQADKGFGNLNCRGGQAIKDFTGFECESFKASRIDKEEI